MIMFLNILMLEEPVRMSLPGILPNHLCQEIRSFKLEIKGGVAKSENLWKLFRLRSISVSQTSEMSAVDPLPVPSVVDVRLDLGPDGLVQLHGVVGQHGPLAKLHEETPTAEVKHPIHWVGKTFSLPFHSR